MDLTVRNHALDAARPSLIVPPDQPLRAVARRLWEAGVGAAVVAGAGDVLGIISERDVVAQLAIGADPDDTTAADAMSRTVVSVRPDDPLLDVVFLMLDAQIRHVPIIDDDGGIDGMVSMRDVIRPLLVDTFGGTPALEQKANH